MNPRKVRFLTKRPRYRRSQRERRRRRLKQLSHYLSMRNQIVSREMIFKWSLPRLCLINYKVISFQSLFLETNIYYLDIHMTTPPPEGSSKATGGIARGKASGNRPNIADLDDNMSIVAPKRGSAKVRY